MPPASSTPGPWLLAATTNVEELSLASLTYDVLGIARWLRSQRQHQSGDEVAEVVRRLLVVQKQLRDLTEGPTCTRCGEPIVDPSPHQIWCGKRCRDAAAASARRQRLKQDEVHAT